MRGPLDNFRNWQILFLDIFTWEIVLIHEKSCATEQKIIGNKFQGDQ